MATDVSAHLGTSLPRQRRSRVFAGGDGHDVAREKWSVPERTPARRP